MSTTTSTTAATTTTASSTTQFLKFLKGQWLWHYCHCLRRTNSNMISIVLWIVILRVIFAGVSPTLVVVVVSMMRMMMLWFFLDGSILVLAYGRSGTTTYYFAATATNNINNNSTRRRGSASKQWSLFWFLQWLWLVLVFSSAMGIGRVQFQTDWR